MVTIDFSDIMSDIAARLSAGETLAERMHDLHYGVMAELEEGLRVILAQIQSTQEINMNNQIGYNINPEPTTILPLQIVKGQNCYLESDFIKTVYSEISKSFK